jgi:hypothetical protein
MIFKILGVFYSKLNDLNPAPDNQKTLILIYKKPLQNFLS